MKSIIVLGNARSGTSMTSGLLQILGVEMQSVHDACDFSQNPKGNFENSDFISLTRKMHVELEAGNSVYSITKKYEKDIIETIRRQEKEPLWGFKSALTHHFLKSFTSNMNNPHIVVVLRNLLDNAKSWILQMRNFYGTNVSLEEALENMAKSTKSLIDQSTNANVPVFYTTYENIKLNPWTEAQKLARFIDVDPESKKQEIIDFIMPEYTTLKT